MAVMLRCEELVFRRKWAVDFADVVISSIAVRREIGVGGDVRERHQRLALRQRGQCPFGKTKSSQASHSQTGFQNRAASRSGRHIGSLSRFLKCRVQIMVSLWSNDRSFF